MNSEYPIGVIELNDVYLKCIIFQINNDNSLEVLSTSISSSLGIHNDIIINLEGGKKYYIKIQLIPVEFKGFFGIQISKNT